MIINTTRIIRCLNHPIKTLNVFLYKNNKWGGANRNFMKYISDLFYLSMGEEIDWKNPKDLNQWIHWLYFNSDTSKWPLLADKYAVRQMVEQSGFKNNLVPLYAEWDDIESFNIANLPDSFVLKMNNGCGDVMIVQDKGKIDTVEIKNNFRPYFRSKYGESTIEDHYTKIQPRLIAEKLLDKNAQSIKSSSMIDYKFWCFNGKPAVCFVVKDRTKTNFVADLYQADESWERIERNNLVYDNHHLRYSNPIPKPELLKTMLEIASKLSKGHPQMRVDLYEADGNVYFGELTMTSQAGKMNYFTNACLRELGDLCRTACMELNLL